MNYWHGNLRSYILNGNNADRILVLLSFIEFGKVDLENGLYLPCKNELRFSPRRSQPISAVPVPISF